MTVDTLLLAHTWWTDNRSKEVKLLPVFSFGWIPLTGHVQHFQTDVAACGRRALNDTDDEWLQIRGGGGGETKRCHQGQRSKKQKGGRKRESDLDLSWEISKVKSVTEERDKETQS